MRVDGLLGTTPTHPRRVRRPTRFPLAVESLEGRALLADFTVNVGGATNMFTPSAITIHPGDTVHWVWEGGFHNVRSVAGIAEQWISGTPTGTVGTTFDHTFTQVGTFAYYCQIHGSDNGNGTASGMDGTVTVVSATPTATPVTVASVQFTQNKKHQVTSITVIFSGPVNAGEADSTAIYRLALPGKNGSFNAKNAKVLALRSAVYDGTLNQVTLTPRKPFALTKPVQLWINGVAPGGLQDTSGQLIDGDHDGQPGGNAGAVLRRKGVTLGLAIMNMNMPMTMKPGMKM
jgi:plastocyanin